MQRTHRRAESRLRPTLSLRVVAWLTERSWPYTESTSRNPGALSGCWEGGDNELPRQSHARPGRVRLLFQAGRFRRSPRTRTRVVRIVDGPEPTTLATELDRREHKGI